MIFYTLPLIFTLVAATVSLIKIDKLSQYSSVLFSILTLVSSIAIAFSQNFSHYFIYIDGASKIMLFTISIIYMGTTIYSISYIKHIHNPLLKQNFYFLWLNLFTFSMLFSVMVKNLGLIWVGIEATTITSALLVAIENSKESIEATWRYIIIVSVGLVVSLFGNVFIFGAGGTLDFVKLASMHGVNDKIITLGILMAVVGYGTKAGIFPMHSWLPDVHGKAPSPISAIFSGVLLPVALFGIFRTTEVYSSHIVKEFMFILGFLTLVTAATLSTVQKYYKRLYAYSSMENMGIALIGISLGRYAILGSVIVIVAHAFAKSAVFYLSGNILIRTKKTRIDEVKNLFNHMPFTAYSLFFASLAATGAPPFATFAGEILIMSKLYEVYGIISVVVFALFASLAFISVNYYTGKMIFSKEEAESNERHMLVNLIPAMHIILAFLTIFLIPKFNLLLAGVIR